MQININNVAFEKTNTAHSQRFNWRWHVASDCFIAIFKSICRLNIGRKSIPWISHPTKKEVKINF